MDDSELIEGGGDIDIDLAGPVNISTRARLISPGVTAQGTLSITSTELYFEVDEDCPEYRSTDPERGGILGSISLIHSGQTTVVRGAAGPKIFGSGFESGEF
ncbi:hypothetical protein WDU94_012096 [Cyamophila willieti]